MRPFNWLQCGVCAFFMHLLYACLFSSLQSTLFTWMQDDSNLRWHPKNKTSAKKKYLTINFIQLIHKAYKILFNLTNQCHFIFTLTPTFPPLHCHSTAYHHQSHPLYFDMQHFLKPIILTPGGMCCHAVMIYIN